MGIPNVSIHRQSAQQPEIAQSAAVVSQPQTVRSPISERVKQAYLENREMTAGQVVTAIEILSPVNKRSGEGRNTYIQKRQRILSSLTHLVEIDLLRGWQMMPVLGLPTDGDYRILISHSERCPSADWYAIDLKEPLPTLPIPLLYPDEFATVNLQTLLTAVYDRGGFDYVLDYSRPLNPELPEKKAIWASQLLVEQGLKS